MKTKFNGILTLLLAFMVQFTFAQSKTISGVVTDESGSTLPGVSIIIKGTSTGTETDFDGNYSITANTGDVLQYSFVGMDTVEKTVGSSNTINVTMVSGNILDEVVINALGIEVSRANKASAISKVKGDAISNSGETGVIQGLSGKASGVSITQSSGDPGAGAYIQIRGQTSITRSLQPLFVVDGIPMNNDELGNTTSGVTQQSRLNDINPK